MNSELERDEKIASREQARRDRAEEDAEDREELDFERDMGERQS